MKKKMRSSLLAVISIIFAVILSATILSTGMVSAFADTNQNSTGDMILNEDITDNIEKDSVIVALTEDETKKFKTYSAADFKEVGCIGVEDLTRFTNDYVKNVVRGNSTDESMLVDTDNYKKILKLTLNKSDASNVINAVNVLNKRSDVLKSSPNYIYTMCSTSNDELGSDDALWGLYGSNGINAEAAWNITTGSSTVTVGVLDTGIQGNHPDLENRISQAGLHRDCSVNPIITVSDNNLVDSYGHGTQVAGIIGAEGNNSIGIRGVCWDVRLVSLKVFGESSKVIMASLARAINYAASANIPILNYSGGMRKNAITEDEIDMVQKALKNYKGLFVCAAGNEGKDNDKYQIYPSDFSHNQSFSDRVISVGAIDSGGNRPNFSNFGANSVSIYAPGDNIYSTFSNNSYGSNFGTSLAAPFVTGVAALLLSVNPDLSAAQLKQAIINGADNFKFTNSNPDDPPVKKLNAYEALLKIVNEDENGYYLDEKNYQNFSMNNYISLDTLCFQANGSYTDLNNGTGIIGGFNGISVTLCDMINGSNITDYSDWTFLTSELVIYTQGVVNSGCYIYGEGVGYVDACTFSMTDNTLHVPLGNLLQAGVSSFILVPEMTEQGGGYTGTYTVSFDKGNVYLNLLARKYI